MKKIWSVLVAAALIFTLAACGNSNSNNTGSNEKGTAEFTGKALVVIMGLYVFIGHYLARLLSLLFATFVLK